MSDRILQRYVNRPSADAAAEVPDVEGEDAESFGCFGWMRGVRDRAISLELRKKTGEILAVNYSYIIKFEFHPSSGIVIHCGSQTIRIKGRNLNSESRPHMRLFQGLTRCRVPFLQEADHAAKLQAADGAVVIEGIEW